MSSSVAKARIRWHVRVAATLLVLGAGSASAFKPFLHDSITQTALHEISLPGSSSKRLFRDEVITEITADNTGTDSKWVLQSFGGALDFLETEHFDNDSLIQSADVIARKREYAIARLILAHQATSETMRQQYGAEARSVLGSALHAIQDFYAHSNWVELNQSNTVNFGTGSPFVADLLNPGVNPGCECGGTASGSRLTSGYWTLTGSSSSSRAQTGFCLHGPDEPAPPVLGCPTRLAGIAKDVDSASPAVRLAMLGTKEYIHSIVRELSDRGAALGICALGGRSSSECSSTTTVTVEVPLGAFTFNGAYRPAPAFTAAIPRFDGSLGTLAAVRFEWDLTAAEGVANCIASPASVNAQYNTCLSLNTFWRFGVSSPDLGANGPNVLSCDVNEQGATTACGQAGSAGAQGPFLGTLIGTYDLWAGGQFAVSHHYTANRRVADRSVLPPGLTQRSGDPATWSLQGNWEYSMIPSIGQNRGGNLEPLTCTSCIGVYNTLNISAQLKLKVTYEYFAGLEPL
jgi:hypothetical protein